VFLDLTEPAHNIANPACIKNTRYADDNKNWLSEEPVMVERLARETFANFATATSEFNVPDAPGSAIPAKYSQSDSVYCYSFLNKERERNIRVSAFFLFAYFA